MVNSRYEPVEVVYKNTNKSIVTPDLSSRTLNISTEYINKSIGIDIGADKMCDLLSKMSLKASVSDEKSINVSIPPTRCDILHACDVMEDVAIAYGYNNVVETVPKASTVAVASPVNKLTDKLRREMAQSGYTEVLSFTLVFLIFKILTTVFAQ